MTGTIKLPSGSAAAIPKLISFFLIMVSPCTAILIIGNFLMVVATACINIGVKVNFSPSLAKYASFTLARHFTIFVTSISIND